MAVITTNPASGLGLTLAALVATLRGQASEARSLLARRRVYRQTVRELSALSDRTLSDLGVGRGDIRAVALEASRNA